MNQGQGRGGPYREGRLARGVRSNRRTAIGQTAEEADAGSDRKGSEHTVKSGTARVRAGGLNVLADRISPHRFRAVTLSDCD